MTAEQWREAYRLYEHACNLQDEERDTWLNSTPVDEQILQYVKTALADSLAEESSDHTGRQIGNYRLVEKIGCGTSGEVYRAEDLVLGRQAAVKLLAPGLVDTSRSRERFLREARAASALNHPNIVTIYEFAQYDGQIAIVMELVEGVSLRERFARGWTARQTTHLGSQIASALQAAHAKGLLHRDIKPENIIVRQDESAKLVDFGLAFRTGLADLEESDIYAGLLVGTLSYMSPEQVSGHRLTAASDIFSLGVVLYESVAGQLPFRARDRDSLFRQIKTAEPKAPSALRPGVPYFLDHLILRMLAKDAAKRPSAAEVAHVLESFSQRRSPYLLLTVFASIILGASALWYTWTRSALPAALQPVRFSTLSGNEREPAFSPDGQRIAFAWDGERGDNRDIYIKPIGSGPLTRLTRDPAPDSYPEWSPDGQSIAFLRKTAPGRLNIMIAGVSGGERNLGSIPNNTIDRRVMAWAPDGRGLLVSDDAHTRGHPLTYISIATGERKILTFPDRLWADVAPAYSPDGNKLAFVRTYNKQIDRLYVMPAAGGTAKQILAPGHPINSFDWSPDGRSLILSLESPNGHQLWRLPASGGILQRIPCPAKDPRDLVISSSTHKLAYVEHYADSNIWRISANGEASKWVASSSPDEDPRYSPDGRFIAFSSVRSGMSEIWTCSSSGEDCIQITHLNCPLAGSPAWSPDSREIAFDANVAGNTDIYVVPASGGTARRITTEASADIAPAWSSDGRFIYFESDRSGSSHLWRVPSQGGEAIQITEGGAFDSFASMDGQFVYFSRGGPQHCEIWQAPAAGGKDSVISELAGSCQFRYWELRSGGIFFFDPIPPASIRRFDLKTHQVTQIVKTSLRPAELLRGFSVSPDSQSFLFVQMDFVLSDIMIADLFR